jgi:allantoinase
LWEALRQGLIDTIGSDHSPAPPELKHLKTGDVFRAWGGIASLQLGVSAVWTAARKRGFDIMDLARWMALRPAELVGLADRKGAIAPGRDADLVVFDPDNSFTVDPQALYHRHPVTPYEGRTLIGHVEATYLRGRPVYRHASFAPSAFGQPLLTKRPSTTGAVS